MKTHAWVSHGVGPGRLRSEKPGVYPRSCYSERGCARASSSGCLGSAWSVDKMVLKKHSAEGPQQGRTLPMETYLEVSQPNGPM